MLCGVDCFAGEHGIAMLRYSALLREIQQQVQGLGVKQAFGGIHKYMGRLEAEPVKALAVCCKGGPQVKPLTGRSVVRSQRLPGGGAVTSSTRWPCNHGSSGEQELI